jgi:uncharacterized Zn ribbon protein
MTYTYQGKEDAYISFELSDSYINENVIKPLKTEGKVTVKLTSEVKDSKGNILCKGDTYWQLKPWNSVKTKL